MPSSSGYAVGWGALALINAGLAQGKRRSGLFWFVISLLLGPVATLLIVLLPIAETEPEPLGRSQWILVAVVLIIFAAITFGLFAAGTNVGASAG